MLSKRYRSLLVATLVLGLLAFSATPSPAAPAGPPFSFWSWLVLWTGLGGDTAAGDQGPLIDPNGGNRLAAGTSPLDHGPLIDPNGGNRTAADSSQLDSGPMIDPNGGH